MTATAAAVPLVVVTIWVLTRLRVRNGVARREARRRSTAEVCAVAGTAPWLWMVMTPRPAPSSVNLTPLSDLAVLFTAPPATVIVQLGGNLLVFAAAGFFLPLRFRLRLPTLLCLFAAAATGVELLQYVLDIGRVTSADDVLVNTTGAALAALASRPWWAMRAGHAAAT